MPYYLLLFLSMVTWVNYEFHLLKMWILYARYKNIRSANLRNTVWEKKNSLLLVLLKIVVLEIFKNRLFLRKHPSDSQKALVNKIKSRNTVLLRDNLSWVIVFFLQLLDSDVSRVFWAARYILEFPHPLSATMFGGNF